MSHFSTLSLQPVTSAHLECFYAIFPNYIILESPHVKFVCLPASGSNVFYSLNVLTRHLNLLSVISVPFTHTDQYWLMIHKDRKRSIFTLLILLIHEHEGSFHLLKSSVSFFRYLKFLPYRFSPAWLEYTKIFCIICSYSKGYCLPVFFLSTFIICIKEGYWLV